jgi:hypothetical protein
VFNRKPMELFRDHRRANRRVRHFFSNGDDMHAVTHERNNFFSCIGQSRAGCLNGDMRSSLRKHGREIRTEANADLTIEFDRWPKVHSGPFFSSSISANEREPLLCEH